MYSAKKKKKKKKTIFVTAKTKCHNCTLLATNKEKTSKYGVLLKKVVKRDCIIERQGGRVAKICISGKGDNSAADLI